MRPALGEGKLMDVGVSFIFDVINEYFSFKLLLRIKMINFSLIVFRVFAFSIWAIVNSDLENKNEI